jgi:hypothetical protein
MVLIWILMVFIAKLSSVVHGQISSRYCVAQLSEEALVSIPQANIDSICFSKCPDLAVIHTSLLEQTPIYHFMVWTFADVPREHGHKDVE